METGFPIVYTSADSVFQIAAHEEVIPLKTLYDMCEKARQILTGEHAVGRVIARPFVGSPEHSGVPKPKGFFAEPYQENGPGLCGGTGIPGTGRGKD